MSSETIDGKTQLEIQKEILQVEDDLVGLVETALENCNYGKPNTKNELEESQFRNLVRVAESTESSAVVKNFLRYQVGRDEKWGRGQNSLAEQIILHIDNEVKAQAETIGRKTSSTETKQIWIELIRRYLGYGFRHLKYLKVKDANEKGKKEQSKGDAPIKPQNKRK